MAVENKLRLNVIAASVLMGLSLSAVASAMPSHSGEVVTPAPVKSLAEAVKTVNPAEVKFDKGDSGSNPSQVGDLDKLLQYMANPVNTRDKVTKSVNYAHGLLFDAYNTEQGEAKATALQHLVAFNRAAALQMVKDDTAALTKAMGTQESAISQARDKISQEQQGLSDADSKAKVAYDEAITDFLKKTSEEQAKPQNQNNLITTLTTSGPLKSGTEYSDIHLGEGGFKTYDELVKEANTDPDNNHLESHKNLIEQQGDLESALSGVTPLRKNLAQSMTNLANSMPFFTPDEQDGVRETYLAALKTIGKEATDADTQSKAGDAGRVTHILGSLSSKELQGFDPLTGEYKSVILNTDGKGNITGVKDSFTANDLYTGTQDNPFTTTVLDIRALELGNGKLSDPNTITVGEAGSKDKKATPVEVWAKTAGVKYDTGSSKYVSEENGPAVKLSGDLRTATAQVDESGNPVEGQVVRGADQIHLQNVNIHNSFTLADRTKMLADDMAAITSEAAEKLKMGQKGVDAWQKTQTDLLNSKYDNLKLTGLQIDTTTVNPSLDLTNKDTAGTFVNNAATVAPTDANILLDNLNITLQNDSVGGTSTAIALSGTGNHIQANGGVFDAGSVTGTGAQANALYITSTGTNNLIDFNGSVLKGDIRSDATGNTVNLTNGSLTGDVLADSNSFSLNLDGNTWTGGTGSSSAVDVSLSNNSVWNVTGGSSTNSLALNGNNTLNLVSSTGGLAQLGGHGFAGTKSGVTLNVATDLTSDGKGVTSVLAGTYSPDNLHSLTNTGLAGGYQFGTLDVNGLATGGKYALSLESSGAEPYTIGGRLADTSPLVTSAHAFVSYKTSESRVVTDKDGTPVTQMVNSDADFTSLSAPAELGVYQYAAEKVMDGVNNRTNIYYRSTGQLSNSAATVVSLAAAPVDVANLESDTLAKHMNSVRHGKDSGVWVSYFGGENRNTTASGPEYKLNTSGIMLGVDTLTENNWLAGVAVSSARSDMSVMNSSGDLDSYGAQFYMSRRYDSGVFVDSALQFNHFSNTAKARMTDGQQAKADFSGNSYGLEAKVGYAWNSEGFFAEPYVRAAARAFDGEHYALSNGMTVNSNDYKSMLGEVGADLGYQYAISGGYVKPYLHLAALNEFADGNSVRVNNVSLDDSVKGAAFQAGLGAEVKVTDNLGGYAAFDYTKGDNTERPWQATVGVNYTW
ncbi:autotransporter outer membrane beta-barrel domain-containing protein [Salmonella enterica subsp. enterica serovar Panama]|uniref:Autotransporter outer membrane beta-barrel domain-containing protein n=1 Tax=Salmonella enterica subsp. enterica serovar Panama TaxID=29472 RepID=A0A619AI13_SALET|nr:autotransporter outer membrane beta-barrel domain-containing protein [Salmonella enterica subsp. enterica serovar Panama]ECX6035867.1 autotransporter outer membrane beta-barrel domain-containing protein [Salmonella enterica subsp. enterica serovar Panama]EGU5384253.1 autotransporter outer membrane beta-barrel domain-containing protein [Salmonella enterica]EGX1720503.1 autotransporter outer membrane beta-barrel domain-containing protein [Salmonella enterica subsp. enterica serovar Panama]